MSVVGPTPAGLGALGAEVAAGLGVEVSELPERLAPLVEAGPAGWDAELGRNDRLAVGVVALMAMGGVPGLARPRLLDHVADQECYRRLHHLLLERFGDRAGALEPIFRRLFGLVPRPLDLYEARRVITLAHGGHPPTSLMSLLGALGVPELVTVGDEEIDAVEAARRVRGEGGEGYALALLEAGVIPPAIASAAAELASRHGPGPSTRPVRVLAGLPAEPGALLCYGAPRLPPRWTSTAAVVPHLARLGRVLRLDGPPTIWPRRELLGLVHLDEDAARAYDAALLDDAEEEAEEIADAEDCSDDEAATKAARRVMKGFAPFLDYLRRAAATGAPVTALPTGIAMPRRSATKYQGVREDLCPTPDVATELLALAPQLVAGTPDGPLVLIQLVSGCRASVPLALRRSYVVEVDEGLVVHVPWRANKSGRGLLLIARPFVDLYGIDASWFPEAAPEDPPQYRRVELAGAIDRLCRRFEEATGRTVARTSVRFTRAALVQLLRPYLSGLDREVITALLGHKKRATRANYVRAWLHEVGWALERWGKRRG